MDISKPFDVADLYSAKGLVIVLTGGGSGIGKAFTAGLATAGAERIFLLGRRLANLEEVAAATNKSTVIPVQCDITDAASLAAAAATVASQSPGGHVDVLINNAGVEGPRAVDVHTAATIEDMAAAMSRGLDGDGAGWDLAWRTNVVAVSRVSAAFLPLLDRANERRGWARGRKDAASADEALRGNRQTETETMKKHGIDATDRRSAQIITVSSISAFNRHTTAGLAYTASKAGSVMLAKSMANFLAPFAIRSNVICPGRYPSEMMTDTTPFLPLSQIPQGASGTYEDLASLIVYLVGKSGAYVNGGVHVVDGGRLSMMPASF